MSWILTGNVKLMFSKHKNVSNLYMVVIKVYFTVCLCDLNRDPCNVRYCLCVAKDKSSCQI